MHGCLCGRHDEVGDCCRRAVCCCERAAVVPATMLRSKFTWQTTTGSCHRSLAPRVMKAVPDSGHRSEQRRLLDPGADGCVPGQVGQHGVPAVGALAAGRPHHQAAPAQALHPQLQGRRLSFQERLAIGGAAGPCQARCPPPGQRRAAAVQAQPQPHPPQRSQPAGRPESSQHACAPWPRPSAAPFPRPWRRRWPPAPRPPPAL